MASAGNGEYWIGFDLGGTKMLATVFDSSFRCVGRERKKTKGFEGQEAGLERMVETARKALGEAGIGAGQLAGIGVGCPGPVDVERGVVLDTPNLGWQNVPVRAVFEEAFDSPTVVANDVDAGLYGEYHFGAAKGSRCVVGAFPGTGIGGACVYEGQVLRGQHMSCMEIGHLPVLPGGPLSGTGQRGTLEGIASRLAISSAAAAAAYRGEAPHLLEAEGTDLSRIRSGALAASIAAGDVVVERLVRDAAGWLGRALAGVVYLLAPDTILLGGGLVEAMPDLFRDEVTNAIDQHLMPSFKRTFIVVVAELGDDATVTGAAALARERAAAPTN